MAFIIGGNTFNGTMADTQDYTQIIQTGLKTHLDASTRESYPGSGTNWYDLSGNENHATLTNGPTFSSTNGGSIVFDGINDYGVINDYTDINLSAGTICAWVKYNTIATNRVVISYGGNNLDRGFLLQNENNTLNKIGFSTYRGAGSNAYAGESTSTPYIGNWLYQVGVYNTTSLKLYLNGSLTISSTLSTPSALLSDSTFWIGGEYNRTYYLDGNIAAVQIYNRVLSSEEILYNYNTQKARFGL